MPPRPSHRRSESVHRRNVGALSDSERFLLVRAQGRDRTSQTSHRAGRGLVPGGRIGTLSLISGSGCRRLEQAGVDLQRRQDGEAVESDPPGRLSPGSYGDCPCFAVYASG